MTAVGKPNWEAVTDDDKIEWLGDLPVELGFTIARKRAQCEALGNQYGMSVINKLYRSWAARGGKRAVSVERLAAREDALKTASELVSGRRQV